jgi:hypothetical protein
MPNRISELLQIYSSMTLINAKNMNIVVLSCPILFESLIILINYKYNKIYKYLSKAVAEHKITIDILNNLPDKKPPDSSKKPNDPGVVTSTHLAIKMSMTIDAIESMLKKLKRFKLIDYMKLEDTELSKGTLESFNKWLKNRVGKNSGPIAYWRIVDLTDSKSCAKLDVHSCCPLLHDSSLFWKQQDHIPKANPSPLKPLTYQIEEFNLNFLFSIMLFSHVLFLKNEYLKIFIILWFTIVLIIILKIDFVFCKSIGKISVLGRHPVLTYSIILWLFTLFIFYQLSMYY